MEQCDGLEEETQTSTINFLKNDLEFTYDTHNDEKDDSANRTKFFDLYVKIANEEEKKNKTSGRSPKKNNRSTKKVRVDTLIKTVLRRMRKFYKKLIKFNTHRLVKQKIVTNENIEKATMKSIKTSIFKTITNSEGYEKLKND